MRQVLRDELCKLATDTHAHLSELQQSVDQIAMVLDAVLSSPQNVTMPAIS